MSQPLIPPEFLAEVATFTDPVAIINLKFPGVLVTTSMRQLAANDPKGRLALPLSGDVLKHLHFDPGFRFFEMTGLDERVYIPSGAILGVMDRATDRMFTLDPTLLKASH